MPDNHEEIELVEQPYVVLDTEGNNLDDDEHAVVFVLRIDMYAKNPQNGIAAREALLKYAALCEDEDEAKQVVRMVGQVKDMPNENIQELWAKIDKVRNNRVISIPKPRKKIIKKGK